MVRRESRLHTSGGLVFKVCCDTPVYPRFSASSAHCGQPLEGAAILFMPSPPATPLCLMCLWLHNCEIHDGARGLFWQLELVIMDCLFCQPFLVSSCRVCHGAASRDGSIDFALSIQTTNLSTSLLIFVSGHLLLHILWIKYLYLQAFLTRHLPSFLKFRMHWSECRNSMSAPWS